MEIQVPFLAYRLQLSIFGSCPGHDLHNRHRVWVVGPFLAIHPCTTPAIFLHSSQFWLWEPELDSMGSQQLGSFFLAQS
jgi:hypothetical protein